MIFVTVGTHEQPFDRLVRQMDTLVEQGVISEPVMIQTGYSTYEPRHCQYSKLLSYADMQKYTREARIIITHGGPSSFLAALQVGKIPIVVPRKKDMGEHVNDHQVEFSNAVAKARSNIIVVEDMASLGQTILNYETIAENLSAGEYENNTKFCTEFRALVEKLF